MQPLLYNKYSLNPVFRVLASIHLICRQSILRPPIPKNAIHHCIFSKKAGFSAISNGFVTKNHRSSKSVLVIFLKKTLRYFKKVYQNISSENEFLVKQSRVCLEKSKKNTKATSFMLQFCYPKHLPTFRHARWHPVHSSPPRCQKPVPMQPPRLHARDCPLHLHKCTRSHSALPFTPPLNAALASQG